MAVSMSGFATWLYTLLRVSSMSSLLEESDSGGGGFFARVALGFGAAFTFGGGASALAFGGLPLRLGCGASVCCLSNIGASGTCSSSKIGSGVVSSTTGSGSVGFGGSGTASITASN